VHVFRSPERDDREGLTALVNQLNAPMAVCGAALKQHIVSNVVPAIRTVKATHAKIDGEVDVGFAKGVLMFDETCKEMELLAMQDEDALKVMYHESQASILDDVLWFQEDDIFSRGK
jgi:hypothetical protein